MPADSAAILSGRPRPVFATPTVRDAGLMARQQIDRNRAAWDKIIDEKLVEWGRDPLALEDEGFVPPSLDVINVACSVAIFLRDEGQDAPTRVVPDGEGGICFERIDGRFSVSLRIHADRTGELLVFDDCRLSSRHHFF